MSSLLDEFVFRGCGRLLSSFDPRGKEKWAELNSFPSHEFFTAPSSFHANFHFACPPSFPSFPPTLARSPPYSASVATATGGETSSSSSSPKGTARARFCREQTPSRVRNCLSNRNRNLLRIANHDFLRPSHHPISHEKQPLRPSNLRGEIILCIWHGMHGWGLFESLPALRGGWIWIRMKNVRYMPSMAMGVPTFYRVRGSPLSF